jgi:hypothetical protein
MSSAPHTYGCCCTRSPAGTVCLQCFVPHARWEAHGRGSPPLHNLVSDSANPHGVSEPLPQSFVGSL